MTNENYQISIQTNADAKQATKAISNVAAWWTANVEGDISNVNDIFTVRFGTTHVTFKITEFVPNKKITWLVTNSVLPWLKNEKEWTDTIVEWQVAEHDNSTTITMKHIGLKPEVECYENCEKGWNFYVGNSLLKLLNEGHGLPDTPGNKR